MKKILLILTLLPVIYLVSPRYMLARSIECYTQYGPCPNDLTIHLEDFKDLPLLGPLPTLKVKNKLAAYPFIRSVSLFRRLPSTLVVSIDMRRPIGQVLGASASVGLVDDQGVIFSDSPGVVDLPLLHTSQDISPKRSLNLNETRAIKALHQVWLLTSSLPTGNLSGATLDIRLQNGLQIVLDVNTTPSSWYSPLQLILGRSKISSKLLQKIDLRFTSPVLTY